MKIMKYNQLINQARVDGQMTDKKLNAALEQLSCDLKKVENENPELYWKILRHQHAVLYDRHYSEMFAHHDVDRLLYSKFDEEGVPMGKGAHWTKSEIEQATKDFDLPSKVNCWDKYVAFNAMYADLCAEMSEEEIIKAAYLFYFCDADWKDTDVLDCTKIWEYMSHV